MYLRAKTERMVTKMEAWDKNLHGWAMIVRQTRRILARFIERYLGNIPARSMPLKS